MELPDEDQNIEDDLEGRRSGDFRFAYNDYLAKHPQLRKQMTSDFLKTGLDPLQVHSYAQELGGYDKVLNMDDDELLELINRLRPSSKESAKKSKPYYSKKLKTYLPHIKVCEASSKEMAKVTPVNDSRSHLEKVLSALQNMASRIQQFNKDRKKRSSTRIPQIDDLVDRLNDKLSQGILELQTRGSRKARRSILWLGHNGIGKTFSLNMLIMLAELPSWSYGKQLIGDEDYLCLEGVIESENVADHNEREKQPPVRVCLGDFQDLRFLLRSDLVIVSPDSRFFPSEEDKKLEKDFLTRLRGRSESREAYNDWRDLATERMDRFPGYLLVSSAERGSFLSTTAHLTRLRRGSTWHFCVRYHSLEALERMLRKYDFFQKEDLKTEMDSTTGKEHIRMVKLLRAFVSPTPASSNMSRTDVNGQAYDEVGNCSIESLLPVEPARLNFKSWIKRIAGKSFVFASKGENSFEDRLYIRRMMYGVMFHGIDASFPAAPGTFVPPETFDDVQNAAEKPNLLMIADIVVYMPCNDGILQDDIEWQDAPGSNDLDVYKYQTLYAGLQKCDGLMMFMEKPNDEAMLTIFKNTAALRLWKVGSEISRIGNFLLQEKVYDGSMVDLVQSAISRPRLKEAEREPLKQAVLDAIDAVRPKEDEVAEDKTRRAIEEQLRIGTWKVFPLLHASLLMNASLRLNFEPCSGWRLKTGPIRTIRQVASEALFETCGREFADTLVGISQSNVHVVLSRLQTAFKGTEDYLKNLQVRLTHAEDEVSEDVAMKLSCIKRNRPYESFEKFSASNISDLTKFAESADLSVDIKRYMSRVRSTFAENVLSKLERDTRSLVILDFMRREDLYNAQSCFVGLRALSTLAVDDVVLHVESIYQKAFTMVEELGKSWLKQKITADTADARILDQFERFIQNEDFQDVFWGDSVSSEIRELVTKGTTNLELRSKIKSELWGFLVTPLTVLYESKLSLQNLKESKFKAMPFQERKQWLTKTLQACLDNYESEVQDCIKRCVRDFIKAKALEIQDIFFESYRQFIAWKVMRNFLYSVGDFKSYKGKVENISGVAGSAIDYLQNRVTELSEVSKVGDGIWFQSWAKVKFILQEFSEDLPSQEVMKLLLDGVEPAKTCLAKIVRLSADRDMNEPLLLANEDAKPIPPKSSSEPASGTQASSYSSPSQLHELVSGSEVVFDVGMLANCVRDCRGYDFDKEKLLSTLASLVEAVFPIVKDQRPGRKDKKDEDYVFERKNGGEFIRSSAELFQDWFEPLTLDDFLQQCSSGPTNSCIVPLLIGVAEMLAVPFLVQAGSSEYLVEPHLRRQSLNKFAFCLDWSEKGLAVTLAPAVPGDEHSDHAPKRLKSNA